MKNNKILLAFSGGLDTSFCVKYLTYEMKKEVHSVIVNSGGFSKEELKQIEEKAYSLGVKSHITLEETQNYYSHIVKFLVFGNVLKNNTYPLSVSSERTHQALALAKYAKKNGFNYIAHGSTGAGNDQIRFDLIFQLISPDIQIVTPIRDSKFSRKDEIEYLENLDININREEAQYSINKGFWGTSIGGTETLTSHLGLPDKAFPSQLTEKEPVDIQLKFEKGELAGINDESLEPVQAIQKLENLAKKYAIGRDIHVGDTIVGIKGRVGFEAASASIIIKAHHLLEKHTLTKWQLHWKQQLAEWYGMFIHESQYFEPFMRDIETFLENSQNTVSGQVHLTLFPYRFVLNGIESDHDLMNSEFGDYGELNKNWDGNDVKGFIKILSNPLKIYNNINKTIS